MLIRLSGQGAASLIRGFKDLSHALTPRGNHSAVLAEFVNSGVLYSLFLNLMHAACYYYILVFIVCFVLLFTFIGLSLIQSGINKHSILLQLSIFQSCDVRP